MSREMKHSGIEWIGEIPKGWRILQVKNLCQISRGRVIPITDMDGSYTYPVYSSQTKNNGCMGYINTYDYNGDALTWTTDGANAGTMFYRTGLFNCTNVCGILQQKQIDIKSDIKFLLYSIGFSARHNRRLDINGFKIMSNEMAEIKFVLPSLSEQQKIANYLDEVCGEVDEMIALQEQMIEELKAYKQSVITEAVTKGLNPNVPMRDSGIDWIGEIPEHWKVTVLRRFATIILGKMLQPNAKSDDDTLEQYICAKDVHFEGIDFSDLKKMYFDKDEKETYQVQKGDMLVVEGGAGAAGSCVLKTDLPDTYIQNSIMIVRPKQGIDIRYIQYFEFSLVKKGYVDFVCNKATIPHFTKDKLSSMPIPLPPLSEQQSIASYLDTKCAEIDALIAIKQAKIDELKDYKKSVIYEYVTGKKEVA